VSAPAARYRVSKPRRDGCASLEKSTCGVLWHTIMIGDPLALERTKDKIEGRLAKVARDEAEAQAIAGSPPVDGERFIGAVMLTLAGTGMTGAAVLFATSGDLLAALITVLPASVVRACAYRAAIRFAANCYARPE